MPDDFYVDPREPDPEFPDRPTHEDFYLLSDVIQGMDVLSGAGVDHGEIIGVDRESLMYACGHRLGSLSVATGGQILSSPLMMALYVDAFTLGKRFAEHKQQVQG